jgi:hypothetical protein
MNEFDVTFANVFDASGQIRHRLGVRGEAVDEQHRRAGAVLDHVERDARALHARCHG